MISLLTIVYLACFQGCAIPSMVRVVRRGSSQDLSIWREVLVLVGVTAQFGVMQLGWPILSDPVVAAVVGSWGVNKVINLVTGMGGSSFLYKHGGIAAFKGAFASLEDRLAPAIILGHKIGQYLPKF